MASNPADKFGIAGKTALITGGSKNIGKEIAAQFASVGVIPLILYREDTEAAEALAKKILKTGIECRAYKADLASASGLKRISEKILKDYNSVDTASRISMQLTVRHLTYIRIGKE